MTDILKQIKLLESQDSKVSEDARHALSLQINLGNGVQNLVAYYAEHRSERALDLLCKIREPHDKILLDSLVETVKDKKALATLFLLVDANAYYYTTFLGQIVQTAPSWTPKIAMHPLFKTVLSHISSCKRIVECIAGILFAALLLPHCSSLPAPVLQMLFSTFIECCKLYRMKWREIEKKNIKQNDEERVNTAHFGFAIREYFHTLYGIYPANFLCYLRNYFVDKGVSTDRTKCDLAKMVLYPLLNGVRFHPNLILMSKEKELSRDRWAQREAHDFLDDCRRVIIGKIPINANNVGWNDSWSEGGMLEALNTPPGSVVATPLQKRSTVDDGNVPIVITSEEKTLAHLQRRRSTGGGSSRSFRLSISSVFKRNTESRRQPTLSTSEPLIEVLAAEVEERQKINENDQPDEAEEAMDCLTPVDGSRSPVCNQFFCSYSYVIILIYSSIIKIFAVAFYSLLPSLGSVSDSLVKKRHRLRGNEIISSFSHLSRISKALFCWTVLHRPG
uniref:Hamartin n=1 Tax=Heterorhabditis bacteriophora TaxID=37862 RepID=A0A1I7X6E3_HETBA